MADVAFDAVKFVVNFIREEARLQGRAGDDVRFIMDEMESMNNLLHQLVSMTKPNNHDTAGGSGGGDYSHLRTWMKQLLELAFDSRNSVELYIQSGDSRCYWLPWAMVTRHKVVSRIRELKERARDISERQGRYGGGGLLVAQRQDGNAGDRSTAVLSNSNQLQRRAQAGSSSVVRSVILDREFVDNSRVDDALLRLKVLISSDEDGGVGDESSSDESSSSDDDLDSEGDKQQQQQQRTQSDVGNLQKQIQLDAGDKQKQPTLSELSEAGDKKQPQIQLDVSDKQLQFDSSDKPQQQPTQSDAGDKQQQQPQTQLDARDKQLQSGGSDKQQQQQPQTQLDAGDMEQQSDLGEKQQQQPQLVASDKQLQSDVTDIKLQQEMRTTKKKKIRVATIVVKDGTDEAAVGETVLKRYNSLRRTKKAVMRWRQEGRPALHVSVRRPPILPEIIVHIANQAKKQRQMEKASRMYPYGYHGNSQAVSAAGDDEEFKDEKQAEEYFMSKSYTSGERERQILVLSALSCPKILDQLKTFLSGLGKGAKDGTSRVFAIVLCTNDSDAAKQCSDPATGSEPPITYSLVDIYLERAVALLPSSYRDDMPDDKSDDMSLTQTVRGILEECSTDEVCMKMILHALYYNPDMTKKEMERLKDSLVGTGHQEKENLIITFCYQTLPNDYKNCLWYSAVFTRGINAPGRVRRASLQRRWVAQGLISEDKASDCFDALVELKFIKSHQVSGMGKVKSCTVHTLVDDLITRESPTVEDLLLNNQLPIDNLDLPYSIRNGMKLHPASSSITSFLNSLSSNSMLLLTVLDLEARKDLEFKDLCTICKIRKLKYLSLRNTNVAHLPKQISQLENLETLDIRGTKVLVFLTVLPNLKHLLAGRIIDYQDASDIIKSKESFSTVRMPRAVETMDKLEILSRVKVTDGAKELIDVGDKLKRIKKLGVVLSGKKATLKDLFLQIEKLSECLRSMSIRMEPSGNWDTADVILLKPPKLLESLHICGIRRGLPPRIKELHLLAKITLRETFLNQDGLCVLGMLPKLRYLRLFYHSFGEGTITFGDSSWQLFFNYHEDLSFKNLTDISIEDDTITSVTLNMLPKLEKMTWSFNYMESLSGVQNLGSLTQLVLNRGSCNPEGIQKLQRDIDRNRNRNGIDFKIVPPLRGEESTVVGPAP